VIEYHYTLGVGGVDGGGLIVRQLPEPPSRWEAAFVRPGRREAVLNTFSSPEVAIEALATFQTGNDFWDAIGSIGLVSPEAASRMLDLSRWKRAG